MSPRRTLRLSLSTQVLLGLVLGIGVGMLCGEYVAFLHYVGHAFMLLLQMTVLPYLALSLITGLGRLTYPEVQALALKVGAVLVGAWGVACAAILVMPLAFPTWESASFFSTSLIAPPEEVNFLTLFIPANPFYAFANNLVPAVVVFSLAVGLALMGMGQKEGLLTPLTLLNRAMALVTGCVSKGMPLGVFAIVASAAGTMDLEELSRLQVYLVTCTAMALFLTLWVLPALITSLTPLTYRQVVGQTRDILVTAFATGSALIVLPLLIERSKALLRASASSTADTEATVEVIVPAFTSFPKIGTLFPMSFVLFAGWFAGTPVAVADYPALLGTGLVSLFGSVNMALPLLLDLVHLPVDLVQLYVVMTVVTSRLGTLLTTMNNLTLTLVGACAVGGGLTVRWRRVLTSAVLTVVLGVVMLGGLRWFFGAVLDNAYHKDKILAGMHLMRTPGPATVHRTPVPAPPAEPGHSSLERVRARGTLRVGYLPDNLPFAFFNATGDLVGFDVEMAHTLARDLRVGLEFVPIAREEMSAQVNTGSCDLIMSGVAVTPERAEAMAFSVPYLKETLAFVVKDHRREAFRSREAVQRLPALRLGVPNLPYYKYLSKSNLIF